MRLWPLIVNLENFSSIRLYKEASKYLNLNVYFRILTMNSSVSMAKEKKDLFITSSKFTIIEMSPKTLWIILIRLKSYLNLQQKAILSSMHWKNLILKV